MRDKRRDPRCVSPAANNGERKRRENQPSTAPLPGGLFNVVGLRFANVTGRNVPWRQMPGANKGDHGGDCRKGKHTPTEPLWPPAMTRPCGERALAQMSPPSNRRPPSLRPPSLLLIARCGPKPTARLRQPRIISSPAWSAFVEAGPATNGPRTRWLEWRESKIKAYIQPSTAGATNIARTLGCPLCIQL